MSAAQFAAAIDLQREAQSTINPATGKPYTLKQLSRIRGRSKTPGKRGKSAKKDRRPPKSKRRAQAAQASPQRDLGDEFSVVGEDTPERRAVLASQSEPGARASPIDLGGELSAAGDDTPDRSLVLASQPEPSAGLLFLLGVDTFTKPLPTGCYIPGSGTYRNRLVATESVCSSFGFR